MQKLIVLGTGHAAVKNCYNTCFAFQQDQEWMLVDGGGGNRILKQLELAQIDLNHVHHLFVSHEHTDHVLGVIWLIRMIGTLILSDQYDGIFHIYAHAELSFAIQTICQLTLSKMTKLFDTRICFHPLEDGQRIDILQHPFTFFDIHSTKAKQFGFTLINQNQEKIVFTGDEPYNEACAKYVAGCDWLLHEAFCLNRDATIYHPYEKHHSTAKDAAVLANQLQAKHLILWHTEEDHLEQRKALYTSEAQQYFSGDILVPNDLETISLL